MQLKIYYKLNLILTALLLAVVAFGVIIAIKFESIQEYKEVIFVCYFLITMGCFFGFKMFEANYDKRMIQKMVINGDIAIANIKDAKAIKYIKDTSFKSYHLWEIKVEYYDKQFNKHEYTLIEKMNLLVKEIPNGTVYITHDENKPDQKFIVQNVMIGHVPTLQPIVQAYENNKRIPIKYLNAYYRDGMVVETYQQSMKAKKENVAETNN